MRGVEVEIQGHNAPSTECRSGCPDGELSESEVWGSCEPKNDTDD
jgi:hypothetical protein